MASVCEVWGRRMRVGRAKSSGLTYSSISMIKLIRKYNKWLLVVLGSFLMVAFLVSSVPSFGQGDPTKRVEGTLGSSKVRMRDLGQAARHFNFLSGILPGAIDNLQVEGATHWFLLSHEARAQGLVGTATDGDAWLEEVATAMVPSAAVDEAITELEQSSGTRRSDILSILRNNPQVQQQLAQRWLSDPKNKDAAEAMPSRIAQSLRDGRARLAGEAGLSIDEANESLASLRGVMRLVQSAEMSNRFSDKRLQYTLQRDQDAVLADVVVFGPDAMTSDAQPPDALLTELFEAGKDKLPDATTGAFGYRQPNRVQLQWFVVSRAGVEAAIRLDSVQTRIEYEKNRATYPGEFAVERANIEQSLRARKLSDALATAEQSFRTRVRINSRSLAANGAIKTLTNDWKATAPGLNDYATAVTEALASNDKLSISAPQIQSRSTWVRVDRVSELAAIGNATLTQAGRPIAFSQVVAQLHEFDGKSALGLQVGVPFDAALRTQEGDLVFFVVTDAKLASAAETIDEVRSDVVANAKEVLAFEQLKTKSAEWATLASTSGLDELVTKFNAGSLTGTTPATSVTVQRQQRFAAGESTLTSGMGREPLRDAVLARANERGRLTAATDADRAGRTLTAQLPVTRSIAIAQIVGDAPVTIEAFRSIGSQMGEIMARNERSRIATASTGATSATTRRGGNADAPFSFESLSKRLKWKSVDEAKAKTTSETDGVPAPTLP